MTAFPFAAKLLQGMVPKLPPTILAWACKFIVIPDGPLKVQPFDPDAQPFSRLLLEEYDSGDWDRFATTGPTQTGKSLIAYVIPILYHLFALGETVVAATPTGDMADDKWREDLLPVIEASPELRKLLPTTGQGSRSGRVRTRVKFLNGATLRFMSGGGSDKSRSAFTSRVLAATEVDGLDTAGGKSREADKLKQLEGRQRSFLSVGIRTYLECTVSITTGRIWQEYIGSTESRIARPCPHCGSYVSPGREHLIGWEDSASELEARANAAWACPSCGETWTEAERYAANLKGKLVHKDQSIDKDGNITGPKPQTRTLGFRWTAVDNHFATVADIAADEWNAARELDHENAEKELCQFVHCIPHDPPHVDLTPLDVLTLVKRVSVLPRLVIPNDCVRVSVGVDTNQTILHWTAIAWTGRGTGYIFDFGAEKVPSDRIGVKAGLEAALKSLSDYFARGWSMENGGNRVPDQVWIDSGYSEHKEGVYAFCAAINKGGRRGAEAYRPSKGYATGHKHMRRYSEAKNYGNNQDVKFVGPGYHLSVVEKASHLLVHVNADHWKAQVHQRLALPQDAELALVLFQPSTPKEAGEVKEFCGHLLAEKQVMKWSKEHGEEIGYERINPQNHWLDATYEAVAAGHLLQAFGAQNSTRKQVAIPSHMRRA